MSYHVEITGRAERDLTALYHRIRAVESESAARWFNGLEEAISALSKFPRRCPVAPESKRSRSALRHLSYGRKPDVYRAIFTIDERLKTVSVLTIRHGAMDEALPEELD